MTLPIGEIMKHTAKVENIEVVLPEILLILKQGAELDREHSVKGAKDRVDIMTLLFFPGIDVSKYEKFLAKYELGGFKQRLRKIIREFKDIKHLNLNLREFKLKKKELLDNLK